MGRGPSNPWMHELRGYYYCELLLSFGQSKAVRERATWVVERNGGNALSAALHRLCLARTYSADEEKAQKYAEMAISELRAKRGNGLSSCRPHGARVAALCERQNSRRIFRPGRGLGDRRARPHETPHGRHPPPPRPSLLPRSRVSLGIPRRRSRRRARAHPRNAATGGGKRNWRMPSGRSAGVELNPLLASPFVRRRWVRVDWDELPRSPTLLRLQGCYGTPLHLSPASCLLSSLRKTQETFSWCLRLDHLNLGERREIRDVEGVDPPHAMCEHRGHELCIKDLAGGHMLWIAANQLHPTGTISGGIRSNNIPGIARKPAMASRASSGDLVPCFTNTSTYKARDCTL